MAEVSFNPALIAAACTIQVDTLVLPLGADVIVAPANAMRVYLAFFAFGGSGFLVPNRSAVANIGFQCPLANGLNEFDFSKYAGLVGAEWHLFTAAGIGNFSRLQVIYKPPGGE